MFHAGSTAVDINAFIQQNIQPNTTVKKYAKLFSIYPSAGNQAQCRRTLSPGFVLM